MSEESKILSREVVEEWAARGQRSKRCMTRAEALKLGPPIKAEIISLAAPLIDAIKKHGIAGALLPLQDTATAQDLEINCYPLHEEIQFVHETWGSIAVEVDSSYSRQRFADSHEAIRARVSELEALIQEFKDGLDCPHAEIRKAIALAGEKSHRILNLEIERDSLRRERAALKSVCAEAYQFAGSIGAPQRVLNNLSDASHGGPMRAKTFLPVRPEECSEVANLRARVSELETDQTRIVATIQGMAKLLNETEYKATLKDAIYKRDLRAWEKLIDHHIELNGQIERLILQVSSLTSERDAAIEKFDQLKIEIINASQCVGYYGDDTDTAITCFTSAIAQAEPRMLKAEEERDEIKDQLAAAIEAGKAAEIERDRLAAHWTVRNEELSALRTRLEAAVEAGKADYQTKLIALFDQYGVECENCGVKLIARAGPEFQEEARALTASPEGSEEERICGYCAGLEIAELKRLPVMERLRSALSKCTSTDIDNVLSLAEALAMQSAPEPSGNPGELAEGKTDAE